MKNDPKLCKNEKKTKIGFHYNWSWSKVGLEPKFHKAMTFGG